MLIIPVTWPWKGTLFPKLAKFVENDKGVPAPSNEAIKDFPLFYEKSIRYK